MKRIWEHKNHLVEGFTKQYDVTTLVYYDIFQDSIAAIKREKQLKEWQRDWKIELIEKQNPEWIDLYLGLNIIRDGSRFSCLLDFRREATG